MDPRELRTRLRDRLSWVSDAGSGPGRADRTGWIRDADVVMAIGPALAELHPDVDPTVILAPASSGYLYGPLVAAALGVGFVGASKERNELADSDTWRTATTPLDYRGRNMELSFRGELLGPSDRVLVIDDWADTGGQLLAMQKLVLLSGARYLGASVIVDGLNDHAVRRQLMVQSLLHLRDLR